jgi:hypothetical protein
MLTGERPGKELEPPSTKVQIDVRLDEVVLRALEKKPELRYQQVSVFKTQVETIAAAEGERAPSDSPSAGSSEFVRILETMFGLTFTSPLAMKLVNISALGFLGSLAFLGFVPVPGMEICFAFSGFAGFFGLIGVAFLVEFTNRNKIQAARTPESASEPRLSRTAIVGTLWAFFVLGLLPMLVWHQVPAGQHTGPAWWQILLMTALIPTGLTAPFGTTILGWIAVAQIRRSAGKLYGLGLAVFDGLLFPLLAVDGLIFWLSWGGLTILTRLVRDADHGPTPLGVALVGTLISLIADFFIVRHIWHAVNKPLSGEMPPTATPTPAEREAGNSRKRRLAFGGAAILAIVLTGLFVWTNLQRPGPSAQQTAVFGPVIERFIALGDTSNSFYSLEHGYVPRPTDFDPTQEGNKHRLWTWLRANKVDVFARSSNGRPVVVRSEMVTMGLDEDDFDQMSLPDLERNAGWISAVNAQFRPQESSTRSRGRLQGSKDTFAFQTRYEQTGLLQVVNVSGNPPGVNIRYKLAQSTVQHRPSRGTTAVAPLKGEGTSISISNLPLQDALLHLAKAQSLNCVLDPRIAEDTKFDLRHTHVNVNWTNITPAQAFAALLENYRLHIITNAQTGVVQITAAGSVADTLVQDRGESSGATRRALSSEEVKAATACVVIMGTSFEQVEAAIEREDAEAGLKLIDHALAQEEPLKAVVQGTPLAPTCQAGADLARSIRKAIKEGNWREAKSLTESLKNMGDLLMDELEGTARNETTTHTVTEPERTDLELDKAVGATQQALTVVHVTDQQVEVEVVSDGNKRLSLYIGDNPWGSGPLAEGKKSLSKLEASDQIGLDDGSVGHGIIWTRIVDGVSSKQFLAITEEGRLPYGEVRIRNAEAIGKTTHVLTIADIEKPDGRRVPIFLRLE